MRVQKSFSAFTLAEVLITLGIIGVVAAMTMPTLINQTNGAQYKAAYKKALSAISQGVTLNVALEDVSFADATQVSNKGNVEGASTKDLTIAGFLANRMNVVNTSYGQDYDITIGGTTGSNTATASKMGKPTGNTEGATNTTLYFNDSSVFSFGSGSILCTQENPCIGVIDVNGAKGPNKEVTSATSPTDIYPVVFYDQTILPRTTVGQQVLYAK